MGILDNDTVIVDAILTKVGRQKLANGRHTICLWRYRSWLYTL